MLLGSASPEHGKPHERTPRKMPHRLMVAVSVSAVCLTSCGAALHARFAAATRAKLAVLGSAPDAEPLPSALVKMLTDSMHPEFDTGDLRQARRVSATEPTWLLPGVNGELCLAGLVYPLVEQAKRIALPPAPSLTCASVAATEAGELIYTQALSTSLTATSLYTRVVGIVPNGVAAVCMFLRRGHKVLVPVIRNAFEAVVAGPRSLQFMTANSGRRRHTIHLKTFEVKRPSPG